MTESTADDTKPRPNQQFIPKLRGKKVVIRMASIGQPITGTLEAYNPYELLIRSAKSSSMPLPLLRLRKRPEATGRIAGDGVTRFNTGYVAQLTQSWPCHQAQEEAKAKHWWQFWR